MAGRDGKPNATGRSSGRIIGKKNRQWRSPPQDEPWSWLTRELLESDAWRGRSIRCIKLIDFLLCDHMANAGRENGRLMATYDQLVSWGISRKAIYKTICEAEQRGLIRVEHGGRWNMTNQPSLFRLTFYADHNGNPATNEWKRFKADEKQKRPPKRGTTVVPSVGTMGGTGTKPAQTKTADNHDLPKRPVVPPVGTASISSLGGGAKAASRNPFDQQEGGSTLRRAAAKR